MYSIIVPCAYTFGRLVGQIFFFGNAFFLVCHENPMVTEGLANLHKTSKRIRDQANQLITIPTPYYKNRLSK